MGGTFEKFTDEPGLLEVEVAWESWWPLLKPFQISAQAPGLWSQSSVVCQDTSTCNVHVFIPLFLTAHGVYLGWTSIPGYSPSWLSMPATVGLPSVPCRGCSPAVFPHGTSTS